MLLLKAFDFEATDVTCAWLKPTVSLIPALIAFCVADFMMQRTSKAMQEIVCTKAHRLKPRNLIGGAIAMRGPKGKRCPWGPWGCGNEGPLGAYRFW